MQRPYIQAGQTSSLLDSIRNSKVGFDRSFGVLTVKLPRCGIHNRACSESKACVEERRWQPWLRIYYETILVICGCSQWKWLLLISRVFQIDHWRVSPKGFGIYPKGILGFWGWRCSSRLQQMLFSA